MNEDPGIRDALDAARKSAERLASATRRFTVAVVLLAVAALGFEIYKYLDDCPPEQQLSSDVRMPVANPPVEPSRPDLFEEPRIDE